MKSFYDAIKEKVFLYDGAKGVMLQDRGLCGEEAAESWNISKPDEVKNVYEQYITAGSDVIQTNTFSGNKIALEKHGLGEKVYEINFEGVRLAKDAAGDRRYVTASVGPTGGFLEPAGDFSFESIYDSFVIQLKAIEAAGAEIVHFETFSDLNELRAAILAAVENTALSIIATVTFNSPNKTLSGNPSEVCAIVCQSLGSIMVGANCSSGPEGLLEPIKNMYSVASVPLCAKANAGMPQILDGKTIFDQSPDKFVVHTQAFIDNGVRLIGGCCGATPEHIMAMRSVLDNINVPSLDLKQNTFIASPYRFVDMSDKKSYTCKELDICESGLADGFLSGDYDDIIDAAIELDDCDEDVLLIDFGDCGTSDVWDFVSNFCLMVKMPLIVKSLSSQFLQKFLRYYPGTVGVVINDDLASDVNLFKRYGALIIDEL